MKYRILALISFLVFFVNSYSSLAQSSSLSFGFNGVQHEDTLYIGDSIHFNFWIINQENTLLNDSISVSCETFDFTGSSISSMMIGDYYNTNLSLNPGDSIFITITEIVSYSSYVIGDNIVVIWPASIGSGPVDTSFTSVHILDSIHSSNDFEFLINRLHVFPNPTSKNIYLSSKTDMIASSIYIYDCFSNTIYKDNNVYLNHFVFDARNLRGGVYFVALTINNKKVIRKIIIN